MHLPLIIFLQIGCQVAVPRCLWVVNKQRNKNHIISPYQYYYTFRRFASYQPLYYKACTACPATLCTCWFWQPSYASSIVPIFLTKTSWTLSDSKGDFVEHSCLMIPIQLSFAWTMWRVRGQTTRNEVVLNLGLKGKEHGLAYTGFSGVLRFFDISIAGGGTSLGRLITKLEHQ